MKSILRSITLVMAVGLTLSLVASQLFDEAALAQKKPGKKKGEKDPPKKPAEKKKIPKDKTPPLMTLKGHKYWINSVDFSADGKLLLTASRDKTVKIWDLKSGKEIYTSKEHPTNVRAALFTPDGKHAISTTGEWNKKKKHWEGEIRIWNTKTGETVKTLLGHKAEILCAALSPNGQLLATGSEDDTAIIWEIKSGKSLHTLKGHKGDVTSVAFAKVGAKLATGSADKTVKIWDAKTGKELTTLEGPERDVRSVTFSPNGKLVAAGSWDGTIRIWNLDGKEVKKIEADEGVLSIAFSNDGKYLAASGWEDTTKVWDVDSGKELFYRNGHAKSVTGVLFSPDDERLVTIGIDQTIKVWDVPEQ